MNWQHWEHSLFPIDNADGLRRTRDPSGPLAFDIVACLMWLGQQHLCWLEKLGTESLDVDAVAARRRILQHASTHHLSKCSALNSWRPADHA
jgi:hypothetical protein